VWGSSFTGFEAFSFGLHINKLGNNRLEIENKKKYLKEIYG